MRTGTSGPYLLAAIWLWIASTSSNRSSIKVAKSLSSILATRTSPRPSVGTLARWHGHGGTITPVPACSTLMIMSNNPNPNPNPFLSSTHASAYLRACASHYNNYSTFRSALYKTLVSDPHQFLTLDGPIVHRRSQEPFSDGSFTITSTHDFTLDCDMHDPDSDDSDDSLSDRPSSELSPDRDQAFHALTRKVTELESESDK